LLAKLDEMGITDETLVLFSSDNGPEDIHVTNASHSGVGSAGPFRGGKRSLYEGGVRLPFIVRWPNRVSAGRVDDKSVVTAVDFLPTLCRLAGVDLPAGYQPDGEDVSDILLKQSRPRTKPLFWDWRWNVIGTVLNRSPRLGIREGDWKLLMNPDRSRVELFDIPRDPSELNNLADRRPEVVKTLSEKLLAWQRTLPQGPVQPTAGSNAYPWPRPKPE
jgi:N-acetylgalactosamine-6-sulfatase